MQTKHFSLLFLQFNISVKQGLYSARSQVSRKSHNACGDS